MSLPRSLALSALLAFVAAAPAEAVTKAKVARPVRKAVKLGLREGKLVEVISAELKPDMLVVTEGSYHLPQTTKVRVTPAQP